MTYDTLYEDEKAYSQRLRIALEDLLEKYRALVKSGDAGNWDPEKEPEVIQAVKALNS